MPEVKEADQEYCTNIINYNATCYWRCNSYINNEDKNFGEKEFKKFHPSGSIGAKLKTVEDLMLKGKKIPFINENIKMRAALKIITKTWCFNCSE